MVIKFQVGKIYWSKEFRYKMVDGKEKVVKVKQYWLCVKRNDRTGYVSFQMILNGTLMGRVESRKIKTAMPNAMFKGTACEETYIGYGGSGTWRNWHYLNAANVKE